MKTYVHLSKYLAEFFLGRDMFQTKAVNKIKTPVLLNNFLFENWAVYETMWKNIVKTDRPLMTVWRMQIAWWMPKATNIHPEYVILIAFPQQQWLHECSSVLHYVYIACLVLFNNG